MTRSLWTADDAAIATGGTAAIPFVAEGVSIDTRSLQRGDLFIALRGPNHDGHDHVADAFARRAAAAMVDSKPPGLPVAAPLVEVRDTREALYALARAARRRSRARIVAVTGSVGKTGTKETLGAVLAAQGSTAVSLGNLNNEFGVPLSLARMSADVTFGVFEIGMNHSGEIEPLSRLVEPEVAIITTVAAVHLENFESTFDIADAKAEIFAGMSGGAAVLNRDNPYFPLLVAAAQAAGVSRIISFGAHPEALAHLVDSEADAGGSTVWARIDGRDLRYRISIPGRHWVINSLAVLAAVVGIGADLEAAASVLATIEAPAGRGRRLAIDTPDGRIDLIDESYNASPASMRAAIETLSAIEPNRGGRHIIVFGDMLELGASSASLHLSLAEPILRGGIDAVFTCGTESAALQQTLPRRLRGGHAATAAELAPLVCAALAPGDLIMVKGSRGMRTDLVVDAILSLADRPRSAANGG
ncbi:MAG: UDP-N-acetylmuramoyl-tripeptide--D-alanyl-D-alanine ligase [Rhodospirillaceae bacterium]|nr:UDP-N-acetylmuramoyl-tripeptide--D-alanyl-D-alanine ligase [Rhodospirillaceae bacterium]